jgi:hypothetical protein
MDFINWIKILPLRYLLSTFIITSILGGAWYWKSTPGPSVDISLMFSIWLIVFAIHFLVYKVSARTGKTKKNK